MNPIYRGVILTRDIEMGCKYCPSPIAVCYNSGHTCVLHAGTKDKLTYACDICAVSSRKQRWHIQCYWICGIHHAEFLAEQEAKCSSVE